MAKTTTARDAVSKEAKPKEPRHMWTDIFAKVLTVLLRGYAVDIYTEYELYKKPMKIDVVVIKILEDVVIQNTVMRFFKKHNIVEFKGPGDILSIGAFDKVLSYFYAYLSQKSVRFDETTVTFVSTKRPRKLLKILQGERKYKIIASEAHGIYYITTMGSRSEGYVPAMQLVVSSELSAEDAEWISAIRDDWTVEYGAEILEKAESTNDSQLRDIAYSLLWANHSNWEVDSMIKLIPSVPSEAFRKWMEDTGVTEMAWQKGRQEGRQEGWREGIEEERRKNAKAMKAKGFDIKVITQITGLTAKDVQQL